MFPQIFLRLEVPECIYILGFLLNQLKGKPPDLSPQHSLLPPPATFFGSGVCSLGMVGKEGSSLLHQESQWLTGLRAVAKGWGLFLSLGLRHVVCLSHKMVTEF